MGGGNNKTTQSNTSSPWEGAQPYIKDVLSGAQTAYKSGKGFDSPNFNTVVPFSPQTLQAQNQTQSIANAGDPLGQAAYGQGQSILNNGGMNSTQQGALSGLQGLLAHTSNPYYEQAVNNQAGQLTNDINRQASVGGRYGSAYNSGQIADQVGQFRNQALSDQWQNNVNNQRGILGDISGIGQQAIGNVTQQQQLAPGLYQNRFAPAQALAGVGAQNEDLATRTLNDQIQRFQTTQQKPWNSLAAYNSLIGGAGQLGGSSTTTAQQPGNGLIQGIGGVASLLGLLGL